MSAAARPHNPLPILATAVLVVMTTQQAIIPVLAPLSRELDLPEFSLGLMMTASAGMFALTSPWWGRRINTLGHRRVLLTGLSLCLSGMIGFALFSELALRGVIAPVPAMTAMIATRSLLFGVGMGAVPTAAMAWVAANTETTAERVAGLSRIGAVQGLAMALGPALGGALAFAGFLGPVWLAPGLLVLALVAAAALLPRPSRRTPAEKVEDLATATASSATRLRPWDPRLWPVVLAGFSTFLTLGVVIICLGFLVQDRLGFTGAETARVTGMISTSVGTFMVLTQGFVVPRLGWAPWRMLRAGIPLVALGAFAMVFADTAVLMAVAMSTLAVGVGFAGPGYTSAPTLLVGPSEQGHVAGLVQSVTGTTFVIGPLMGSTLYGFDAELPLVLGGLICTLAAIFVWTRAAHVEPGTEPAATPEPASAQAR